MNSVNKISCATFWRNFFFANSSGHPDDGEQLRVSSKRFLSFLGVPIKAEIFEDLGKFWRAWEWKRLVYSMPIWYIYSMAIYIPSADLVHFPLFGTLCKKICQPSLELAL
jgi:hypothetical protein